MGDVLSYSASTCSNPYLTGQKKKKKKKKKIGNRRLNRKKRADRVNSEISLNSRDVSSDSESENAVVCREDSQTLAGLGIQANGSEGTDQTPQAQTNGTCTTLAGLKSQNNEQTAQANTGHGLRSSTVSAETSVTGHTTQSCSIRTGPSLGYFISPPGEGTLNTQAHLSLQSTAVSVENTEKAYSVSASSVMSQNNFRGTDMPHTQPDTGLQSTRFESADNSVSNHIRTADAQSVKVNTGQAYSFLQENMHGEDAQYVQDGTGLTSSKAVRNSRVENVRAGSGDEQLFRSNGEWMSSLLQNFCTRISQQNETQNKTLNDCLAGTTTMLRECLAGVTTSVSECMKGMARMVEESNSKLCSLVEHNSVQLSNLTEQNSNLYGLIQGTFMPAFTTIACLTRTYAIIF